MIATEYATPLSLWLDQHRSDNDFINSVLWGLYCVINGIQFLTMDCKVIHGNLTTDSIYVTKGGDWKIGGFELLTDAKGTNNNEVPDNFLVSNDNYGTLPDYYKSSERLNKEWALVTVNYRYILDTFSIGILIIEIFNGYLNTCIDPKTVTTLINSSSIPVPLRSITQKLVTSSPRQRPSPQDILSNDWFKQPLVGVLLFLDELALKESKDKVKFFTALPKLLSSFPDTICKYRILPSLMIALEYGAAEGGGTIVLAPILDIGARLPPNEYASEIVPCIVRLFTSNDRATRLQLLQHLPSFIHSLPIDIINSTILNSILTGFMDTNAILREATVKSALTLAPFLTSTNFHTVLFRALKRSLDDPEPAVRVNTVICLGRVAEHVELSMRDELLSSFLRSMRDNFSYARSASLRATAHALKYFSAEMISRKIVPAAAYLALDPVADVRSAAFTVMESCLTALKEEDGRLKSIEEINANKEMDKDKHGTHTTEGNRTNTNNTSNSSSSSSTVNDASPTASSTGMGSMMIGALGWAVTGLANRIIVSGNMDDTATNSSGVSSNGGGSSTPVVSNNVSSSSNTNVNRNISNNKKNDGWDDKDNGWDNNDDDDLDNNSSFSNNNKSLSNRTSSSSRKSANNISTAPVTKKLIATKVEKPITTTNNGWDDDNGWDEPDDAIPSPSISRSATVTNSNKQLSSSGSTTATSSTKTNTLSNNNSNKNNSSNNGWDDDMNDDDDDLIDAPPTTTKSVSTVRSSALSSSYSPSSSSTPSSSSLSTTVKMTAAASSTEGLSMAAAAKKPMTLKGTATKITTDKKLDDGWGDDW